MPFNDDIGPIDRDFTPDPGPGAGPGGGGGVGGGGGTGGTPPPPDNKKPWKPVGGGQKDPNGPRTPTYKPQLPKPPVTPTPPPVTPEPPPPSSPPPSTPTERTVQDPREVDINGSAAGQYINIALGNTNVLECPTIYANSFTNGTVLYMVLGVCEGPVSAMRPYADLLPMVSTGSNTWSDSTGLIQVWTYNGSQTTVDSASGLTTFDPTWDEVHTGLAYAIVKMTFDPERLNAIPSFTFEVDGFLCYNPATATNVFTNNPSLQIREVLSNQTWGLKVPANSTYFDDSTWTTAAQDCDYAIWITKPTAAPSVAAGATGVMSGLFYYSYTFVDSTGTETLESPQGSVNVVLKQIGLTIPVGPTLTTARRIYRTGSNQGQFTTRRFVAEIADNTTTAYTDNSTDASLSSNPQPPTKAPSPNRYRMGITIARQASGSDWLNTLRSHCMGIINQDNGRYQFRIDKALPDGYVPKVFSTAAFTDPDSTPRKANVDPMSVQVSRKNRADLFNSVQINILEHDKSWAPTSVTGSRQAVIDGTEMPRLAVYELQGCPDKSQAGRLKVQYLNRAYDDLMISFHASRDAIEVQPWDVIRFIGAGLDQQLRVLSVTTSGEEFDISGVEYQPNSYSDVIQNEDSIVTSTLPNPNAAPPNPTGLTLTEVVPEGPNGGLTSKIEVDWTPAATPFYKTTRIVVNDGSGDKVLIEASAGPVYIENPRRAILHTVKAYTINLRGVPSTGVSSSITPIFAPAFVPDVTGLTLPNTSETDRGTIIFTAPNYDFSDAYEIYDLHSGLYKRIHTVLAKGVPPGAIVTLKLDSAIHGDGYSDTQSMNIVIKTVNQLGERSTGVPGSWSIAPSGIAHYSVGYDPRDVILDANGRLWVTNYRADTVQRMTKDGDILATVAVGVKPYGVTFGSGYVWVCNFGSDSISKIDPATETVVSTLSLDASDGPLGIIHDGVSLWVTCHSSGELKKIDPSSHAVESVTALGSDSKPCLVYSLGAFIYVAAFGHNKVYVLNAD